MIVETAEEKLLTPVGDGADDMQQYLSEIRRYPRLTPEEERDLAMRCAQADEEAIRRMVNSNLRLVVSVAKEYAGRGVPLLDLIQEGSIGLLTAAKKFDYTMDYRFSTYATKWIRQGVSRCLANHADMIRIPEHTAERVRKIAAARSTLLQELEQEPTPEQIAGKCGFSLEKVKQLLTFTLDVCSLETPAGPEEDSTLGLLLEDTLSKQPYEELVREELSNTIAMLLGALTDRQRQVLQLHFGLNNHTEHSLEEIGQILGISKERARQIEKQAMEKLQILGASMGLEDFLNE